MGELLQSCTYPTAPVCEMGWETATSEESVMKVSISRAKLTQKDVFFCRWEMTNFILIFLHTG